MIDFPSVFHEGMIFLVDKPIGWTSFDAVAKIRNTLRKYLDTRKIKVGHAGTLDPEASGLLIICSGRFTKRLQVFQDEPKRYEGTMLLGKSTPSFDVETVVDQEYPTDHITKDMIDRLQEKFVGEIDQMPPIYSALKTDGKRAYEMARKGEEVVLKSRKITIYNLSIDDTQFPELRFTVECSKGTYIRSLVRDIGMALNSGAYMTQLRRTASGGFQVSDALSPDEWSEKILSGSLDKA